MTRYGLAAALALVAIASGCDFAARTGIVRDDMAVLTDAQNAIANTKINHGDMTIQASVDRADTTYAVGQPIILSVSTSKDAHVAILRVLPNGDTTLLFPVRPKPEAGTADAKADKMKVNPDKAHPKADIAANQVLTIPGPHDGFTVTVDRPGVVLFEFVASTAGDSWLFKRAPDKDSNFADLGVTSRAIAKDIVDSLKVGRSGADTAATYATVRVK
ncbi:MAG TPA: DUF4384 domain-containing protein [Stellaceae bacterium]|nr:DUF4384 domain-containing protein [Stellaceae bacterium]